MIENLSRAFIVSIAGLRGKCNENYIRKWEKIHNEIREQ